MFFVVCLPSRLVRASVPRGRWVFDEDLSRAMWPQILRGPRPPSVQWLDNQSNVNVNLQQRLGGRQPNPRNRRRWQSSGTRQRVQPTEARNVRESRTPTTMQLPTMRKVGEGHRDPWRGESPSARFDSSVEASSGAPSRASDWSLIGFFLVRLSSSVPGSASLLPRRKLPRHSARKVPENSSSSKGWQGWRSCAKRQRHAKGKSLHVGLHQILPQPSLQQPRKKSTSCVQLSQN